MTSGPSARDILSSLADGRNSLLYGPPGTGKTRVLAELHAMLKTTATVGDALLLDPDDADRPLSLLAEAVPIPTPAKVVWTTFHQSYGYEDFVLGLRPDITDKGTRLEPWAGVFLDAALELADPKSDYKSVVIFIDEINRGNAARILGEFMTFLDFDYRVGGAMPLPLPLRQLSYVDGKSEPIRRSDGTHRTIDSGFTFPRDIYIVATMNSVDRAAVPIDSALARRFDRLEMRPNLSVLADWWQLDESSLPSPDESNQEQLTVYETAYFLLDRINLRISAELGAEFELGHGLMLAIVAAGADAAGVTPTTADDDAWRRLARCWDDVLLPQLEDRYSGRSEQFVELVKADTPPTQTAGSYAWTFRSLRGGATSRVLAPVRVSELNMDVIKRSFRWLTF